MKQMVSHMLVSYLDGFTDEEIFNLLEVPPDQELGDYSLPCFQMAKNMKKAPQQIAEDLKERLQEQEMNGIIKSVNSIKGYLNIHLNRAVYIRMILKKLLEKDYGASQNGDKKTICIDYSSPNIAKNFHVGHLRTTLIGNSLANIYNKLGYHVVRINYLGDWGTQFGKLIVAYKKWSSKELVEKRGIEELLRIYVLFSKEAENNHSLMDEARMWFSKMELQDKEALSLWQWFKEISLVEFQRIYDLLDVKFDCYSGESIYQNQVAALVSELTQKQLLVESQGARVVPLQEYDMPPCLITKMDGGSIYTSRDLAAALDRKKQYQFNKCLYVTGLEQKLHFSQVFKVIELMGYEWSKDLVHVPYGLVSLGGEKLSTRNGTIVYAQDLLFEAINRARNLINEKNPNLIEKEKISKQVGVGAIIFHDMYNQRIKNIDFKWEEVLSFTGATGAYIQYTYARAKSILRKAGKNFLEDINIEELSVNLCDDISYSLLKLLEEYPSQIIEAANTYEPSVIAKYVYSVAVMFNKFYAECNIMNAESSMKEARLLIVFVTQTIIESAMFLLGIYCPEEM